MSQQYINVGAVANDGTGQSLRTAFEAVNNNFSNIWAQGPVDSQVVITNNVISTNVSNSPLVLRANGIAEITVTSSVAPSIDSVFDLGSSSKQFDTVWSRYYVGQDGTFSRNLTVGGNLVVTGNVIEMGNIVTDSLTIQLANTASTANAANGAGITVGSNDNIATFLYNSSNNVWVTNIGLQVNGGITGTSIAVSDATVYGNIAAVNGNFTSNVSVTGNVSANYFIGNGRLLTGLPAGYANSNAVSYGESGWAGNLIPSGNAVYSLGNSSHQWNDLYVSNATIYMNNVPISLTSSNVLTVAGQPLLSNNSNTTISTTGNVTADYFFGNGSQLTGLSTNSIANGNSEVAIATANGNVTVTTAGDYTWTFDNQGNLTFPDNSGAGWPVNQQRFGMGNIGAWLDGQWTIGEFSGNNVSGQVGIRIDPGIEGNTGITLPSQADSVTQPVFIYNFGGGNVQLTAGNSATWTFANDGNIQLPQYGPYPNPTIGTDANANVSIVTPNNIVLGPDAGGSNFVFGQDGNLTVPGSIVGPGNLYLAPDANNLSGRLDIFLTTGPDIHIAGVGENLILGRDDTANVTIGVDGNVYVQANTGTAYTWQFGGDSHLIVPGNIQAINTGFPFNSSIADITTGNPTVLVTLQNGPFPDPVSGQVTISGVVGTTEANGTWWYQATNSNEFELYTDSTLSTPVNGTAWTAYVSGGLAVCAGYNDIAVRGGNVTLKTGTQAWTFNDVGGTVFPTLTVQRGDTLYNTITGSTLNIGDGTQEAIITTPDATSYNAQRLVINPGKGQDGTGGEGGDIYLWAGRGGDTNGNGGDVKIRGGYGPGNGSGGYIRVEAGDVQGTGTPGYIYHRGGDVGIGTGGYIQHQGGTGTTGGYISLTGGYGTDGPGGAVTIAGGQAAGGLSYYGNVAVQAGASTWSFDNTGVLTVPGNINTNGHQVVGGSGNLDLNIDGAVGLAAGTGVGLILTANGRDWTLGTDGNLYVPGNSSITTPTATGGAGGNSVTVQAGASDAATWNSNPGGDLNLIGGYGSFGDGGGGNGGNVNIYGGGSSDSLAGNVTVNSGTNTWNFGNDGSLTLPGGAGFLAGSSNQLKTNDGTTNSLDIRDSSGRGFYTDGSGYTLRSNGTYNWVFGTDGNSTAPGNVSVAGNVTASNFIGSGSNVDIVAGTYDWAFDSTGNLTLPGNTFAVNYANGTPVSLGGGSSYGNANVAANLAAFGSNPISTTGNITAGNVSLNGNLTVNGSPIYGAPASYAKYVRTATQTGIASNSVVVCNVLENAFGSDISVDTSTGNVTLQANNTYRVRGTVGSMVNNGNPVSGAWQWRNVTGNVYIGTSGSTIAPAASNYNTGASQIAEAVFTPSVTTVLQLTVTTISNGSVISTPAATNEGGAAWIDIEVIGGQAPITGFSTAGNIVGGNVLASGIVSTAGNIVSGNGFHLILGNATSALRQNSSNANIQLSGSVTLNPDTAASALNGVKVGGNGYLLAASGARVLTLNTDNSLTVAGNLTLGGSTGYSKFTTLGDTTTGVNAVVAGQSATILANSSATFAANVNNYTQVTFQNKSTGADATADYILTADNGSDTVNYGDFGIINSGYDNSTPTNSLGNIVFAADTYLYAQGNTGNASQSGGNLAIGTTVPGKTVKIFAGGVTNSSIIANISNTGVSVTGNVTASNFIGNISITGNVTGTSANVSLVAGSYTATFDNTGVLTLPTNGGDEGGELRLGVPATNTTLQNRVTVDVYQDRFRIFEGSANAKGAYIDLSQAAAGVATLLNNRVGTANLALNTSLTFDNLAIQIRTQSSGVWIFAATVSGSATYQYAITYQLSGGGAAQGTTGTMSATTTPATVGSAAWFFSTAASQATVTISDTTNNKMYRATWQTTTGSSPYGNFVSIERLV